MEAASMFCFHVLQSSVQVTLQFCRRSKLYQNNEVNSNPRLHQNKMYNSGEKRKPFQSYSRKHELTASIKFFTSGFSKDFVEGLGTNRNQPFDFRSQLFLCFMPNRAISVILLTGLWKILVIAKLLKANILYEEKKRYQVKKNNA